MKKTVLLATMALLSVHCGGGYDFLPPTPVPAGCEEGLSTEGDLPFFNFQVETVQKPGPGVTITWGTVVYTTDGEAHALPYNNIFSSKIRGALKYTNGTTDFQTDMIGFWWSTTGDPTKDKPGTIFFAGLNRGKQVELGDPGTATLVHLINLRSEKNPALCTQ